MCTKRSHVQVLINTVPWSASWSVLGQHPNWYLVDTPSTLDQQWVNSWPNVDQLICINWKVVDCQPRCGWSLIKSLKVSIEINGIAWNLIVDAVSTPLVDLVEYLFCNIFILPTIKTSQQNSDNLSYFLKLVYFSAVFWAENFRNHCKPFTVYLITITN